MPKLYFKSEMEAVAAAAACHAWLIEHDQAYAESVAAGQTVCWSMVARDGDFDGGGNWTPAAIERWFILVSERVKGVLPQADQDALWPQDRGGV